MVTELTDSNFDKFIADNSLVIIDCWAPWCGPCRRMTPIMDELDTEFSGRAAVAKLNVDDNNAISLRFGIRAIPTLLIFKNQVLVEQLVGLRPKEDIVEFINGL